MTWQLSSTIQHLIAGTIGGVISTAGLYPLELIKTRMQVIDGKDHAYRSLSSAFRTVVNNEGVIGLYQGMWPAMLASAGSWGGYFFCYEASKARKLASRTDDTKLNTIDHLSSGIEAGVILVIAFNPFWVIKTRLALQGAEAIDTRRYRGMIDAARTIAKEEGLAGFYKGLLPALFLTSHGAIQFAVYENMKSFALNLRHEDAKDRQPAIVSVGIGGASKIIASTLTYPYQVVKSRLQQRDLHYDSPRYNGTWDCIVKIWRQDRFLGFFRGVVPNVLKVAPSSAITFLVYEECLHYLKQT